MGSSGKRGLPPFRSSSCGSLFSGSAVGLVSVWTYVFHENGAFVATPVPVFQCWDQAAGVDLHELRGFLVGVYFDVLVVDAFELEGNPNALYERTAARPPSAVYTCWQSRHTECSGDCFYQKQLP